MAKISKELVEQREKDAMQAFRTGASVKQVNNALALKYGKKMGLKRIYELRDLVTQPGLAPEE